MKKRVLPFLVRVIQITKTEPDRGNAQKKLAEKSISHVGSFPTLNLCVLGGSLNSVLWPLLFSVSTLSLGDCVHSHALYTVLHTPSFCMLPIVISIAPLP